MTGFLDLVPAVEADLDPRDFAAPVLETPNFEGAFAAAEGDDLLGGDFAAVAFPFLLAADCPGDAAAASPSINIDTAKKRKLMPVP
jgi:hypothetical protein